MFDRENYIYTTSLNKAAYVGFVNNIYIEQKRIEGIIYFLIPKTKENIEEANKYYDSVHEKKELCVDIIGYNRYIKMLKDDNRKLRLEEQQ
ncbi:hypothetical protein [Clostridium sp. KNHs214]|uniref:hypothetical protein n=1 Tax=Clostridium sp. KNHs214 TaxID=1540257 RepID=UPI0005583020|nr:hypothetical protein [Clostridium sp. KNHs214]